MEVTNKPATPLPWKSTKRSMQLGVSNIWMTAPGGQRVFKGDEGRYMGNVYVPVAPSVVKDLDYASFACNAYPKLVAALKSAIATTPPDSPFLEERVALLRELGEAS